MAPGPSDGVHAGALGSSVEVTLGSTMAVGGDAIGRHPDGRVVFVEGALPGETVVAAVTRSRRDYATARTSRVVVPSAGRVAPPCPAVAAGCGGCGWQHVDVAWQPRLRQAIVADALRRIARIDPDQLLSDASVGAGGRSQADDWRAVGDRTTVHLGVDGDGRLSYRKARSHDLVAAEGCGVLHPILRALVDAVRLPSATAATVRVGVAGGERLVVVDAAGPGWNRAAAEVPPGTRLVGPADAAADASTTFSEDVGGRRWRVSARSFFQAGPRGASELAAAVLDAAGPVPRGAHVVDLYAGVGILGGLLAAESRARLTAVESDASAVADARHNLADLPAEVVAAEVAAWTPVPADLVVADPARSGLGRPGTAAVVATGARRVVLVSCDPASLARDVALLATAGYRPRGVSVIDLFPHTPHVEAVTSLERVDAGSVGGSL